MSEVFRICPQCGGSVALSQKHCGSCGFDGSSGKPLARRNLPATIAQAALPIVAGLTTLAVRSGLRLLRRQIEARTPTQSGPSTAPLVPNQTTVPAQSGSVRRRIHIRSSWVVGDGAGNWQQGQSEHTIEIEE